LLGGRDMATVLLLFALLPVVRCLDRGVAYVATSNISQASFAAYTMRTEGAGSHLDCSAKCDYWAEREGACNSYSFKGGLCAMAVLGFLEEVVPAEAEQVMVEQGLASVLERRCGGGHHCCRGGRCGAGEGGCEQDRDCRGHLVCGSDNCTPSMPFWSSTANCCTSRCSSASLCAQGEGPCSTEADCEGSSTACVGECLDRAYFPVSTFPNLSLSQGFVAGERCCHRRCSRNYYRSC